MSKAPGLAKDYDGSGPWFKIFDWGTYDTISPSTEASSLTGQLTLCAHRSKRFELATKE